MVGGYPAAVDATGRRRAAGAGGSCQDLSQAGLTAGRRVALGTGGLGVPAGRQAADAAGAATQRFVHAAARSRARPGDAGGGVRVARLSLGVTSGQQPGAFAAAARAGAVPGEGDDRTSPVRL